MQHQRIEHSEDDNIRTNGHGERENGSEGKPWRAPQLPQRIANILQKGVHRGLAKPKKEPYPAAFQPPNRPKSGPLIPFRLVTDSHTTQATPLFNSETSRPYPNKEFNLLLPRLFHRWPGRCERSRPRRWPDRRAHR